MKTEEVKKAIAAAKELKSAVSKQIADYQKIETYYSDLIAGLEATLGTDTTTTETPPPQNAAKLGFI